VKSPRPPAPQAGCLRELATTPAHRYASAAALADDLRAFQRGEAVEAHRLTWRVRLHRILRRMHRDMQPQGWSLLFLLLGVTIFVGCTTANVWEVTIAPPFRWWAVLMTKLVQIAVMLYLGVLSRPGKGPVMPAAEGQIWSLVPGYSGGFLPLLPLTAFLDKPIPLAPVLSVMSGMGFTSLGAAIWGWFYV